MEQNKKIKVFGIGLSRTGTTSLTKALNILGWNVVHYPGKYLTSADAINKTCQCANRFEGITDVPAAIAWNWLAVKYPSSKFILTVRDENKWIDSCRRWWGRKHSSKSDDLERKYREAAFGISYFDEKIFRDAYMKHKNSVIEYFENEGLNRLLILDICGGCDWSEISEFLNVPKPICNFPNLHSWTKK